MLLEHSLARLAKLHGGQFKSSLFEFLHNLSDHSSLHPVRLYHNVSSFFEGTLWWLLRLSILVSLFAFALILLLFSAFLFTTLFACFLLLLGHLFLREELLVIRVEVHGCTTRFAILSSSLRAII